MLLLLIIDKGGDLFSLGSLIKLFILLMKCEAGFDCCFILNSMVFLLVRLSEVSMLV